jgi:hypothetical protein
LDVVLPLGGNVFLLINCLDWALIDAQCAVDARIWVDVELLGFAEIGFVFSGVNAVNWADVDAACVFGTDAGLCDDVGHGRGFYGGWEVGARGKKRERGLGSGEREENDSERESGEVVGAKGARVISVNVVGQSWL